MSKLGGKMRRLVFNLAVPVVDFAARKTKAGYTRPVSDEYTSLAAVAQAGDVLVTRIKHAYTNPLIPGHYKHALMCIGDGLCVEASYPKVRIIHLLDVVARSQVIACLRPTFIEGPRLGVAIDHMESLVGKPYDFRFEPNNMAFYCSEAVWASYLAGDPKWNFERRERLGTMTVVPQDFKNATKYFKEVWSNG